MNPYTVSAYLREFPLEPAEPLEDLGWRARALCTETDPEVFFPERGGKTRPAKRVCRSCEVRAECLAYALGHGVEHGIWGGTSEQERRRLRRAAVASVIPPVSQAPPVPQPTGMAA